MYGIPPAKDSDDEDVVWGLQTADTLWKRGERIDAVVWLRRAAQAAGETGNDDRALELARHAAELTDWMAAGQLSEPPPPPAPEPRVGMPTYVPDGEVTGRNSIDIDMDEETARARPRPPQTRPPSQPTMQTAEPAFEPAAEQARESESDGADEEPSRAASVPPAEQVHAGLFNPWDDRGSAMPPEPLAPLPPKAPNFGDAEEEVVTSVRSHQLVAQRAEALASIFAGGAPQSIVPPARPSAWADDHETPREVPGVSTEVAAITAGVLAASAPSGAPSAPSQPARPPARPPPLPARALKNKGSATAPAALKVEPPSEGTQPIAAPLPQEEPPLPEPPVAAIRSTPPEAMRPRAGSATSLLEAPPPPPVAPSALRVASEPPPPPERVTPVPPSSPTEVRESAAPPTPRPTPLPAPELPESLDLDDVDAFADLPDDARRAFAAAAHVSVLAEGEEVSSFALAYVLSGSVDVAATMVDAPAGRLEGGVVLRARGTTEDGVPMRLIGVESGVVATWTDAAVTDAFRTCPWVEEDLRVAADRWQTLVGVTIGPLGERLDTSIRQQIIDRLTMRTLLAGDVVVTAGEQMPGLLLVGVGELEIVDGERVTGSVGSGDFLFPTEVLGAGRAPFTARAGAGGALILFGDRLIAQELLVTCPPLLEVFAGM